MRSREEAVELAKSMRRELGPQWRLRVWKNFGWHCAVYLNGVKRVEVHGPSTPRSDYLALVHNLHTGHGSSAKDALCAAVLGAQALIDELTACVEAARASLED